MNDTHDGRIPALDGIRGLGMCLVLVQHYFYTRETSAMALPVFDRTVWGLVDSGWWVTDSFFVLSAFLITGILLDSKGKSRYFVNFYARRTLRIFPLYYGSLLLFFVLLPLVPHPAAAAYVSDSLPDQAWFWSYMTNFRIAALGDWYGHLVPTVFWSLAVEGQFYLVWPVVVLLCPRRILAGLCVALIVIAACFRVGLAFAEVSPVATFVLTPSRMDCLAVGTLLALRWRDERAWERTARAASRALLPLSLVLILLFLPAWKLDWKDPLTNTLGFTATALLCGAIIVRAVHAPPTATLRRFFEGRWLRTVGRYSYAMYIFHGPVASFVKLVYDFDRAPPVMGSALPLTVVYTLIASALTFAVAWLSWNLLESPFLRLQNRFRRTPPFHDRGQAPRVPLPLEGRVAGRP